MTHIYIYTYIHTVFSANGNREARFAGVSRKEKKGIWAVWGWGQAEASKLETKWLRKVRSLCQAREGS